MPALPCMTDVCGHARQRHGCVCVGVVVVLVGGGGQLVSDAEEEEGEEEVEERCWRLRHRSQQPLLQRLRAQPADGGTTRFIITSSA